MQRQYEAWLRSKGYDENTVKAQLYRSGRVEQYYGDFDEHFENDRLQSVVEAFVYTAEDARQNRPNPTLIPFKGATAGNMSSYKFSVVRYREYRDEMTAADGEEIELNASEVQDVEEGSSAFPPPALTNLVHKPISGVSDRFTLLDFSLDGFSAFEALIAGSRYKNLSQAIASLTLFSHPETVKQTGCKSIFRTIRGPRTPGEYIDWNGQRVMLDDNKSASDAFKWAHGITTKPKDLQFNHIYTASKDVDAYTSLANICVTPAFIAKLTDSGSPTTSALLKYRAYDLYGWIPAGIEAPNKPKGYDDLNWAATMPPVPDVEGALKARMAKKPKDRTVISTKNVGWLFEKIKQ